MNKRIIFIGLLLIVIAGFVAFFYYRDKIFSKEILRLEILGPDNAKMGDEIEYTIKYKNNGNFALESPKLIFELPDNSLTEDSKLRITQDLEDIYPGDEDFVKFKTRLLGKEGNLKVARTWLSYKPHNLSVRYESDTTLSTRINTVPITLTYDLPSKVEKGKEITYSINYFSNIDYPLENLSIKIDSVSGFNFESADLSSLDNAEWKLSTLNKAQGGRINIKGIVSADAGTNLNFSAKLGMWQDGNFVVIKEANQDLEVIQSLLFISQQINGSSHYIASPGETLNYQIFFRNIGSTPFDNLFSLARLDGAAVDLSTLRSLQGQARSGDNLIVFDSKQISSLQHINPQQEVSVDFSVKLKDSWSPPDAEKNNTMIKNKVDVSGINQEFDTKVNSKLELSQKAYYSTQDNIQNSGPIPPEADKTTTYNIVWQVKNYFNDVKNVKVKVILPQGVSLTANISPENQISNFSLDSQSREILWSVGDLSAGTGISSAEAKVAFQVALTPGLVQRGILAGLVGQATVYGEDQFTGSSIQGSAPAVNTSLPDDQPYLGKGIVQ